MDNNAEKEPLEEVVDYKLISEEIKDKLLRTLAEHENFKKRVIKEKEEIASSTKEKTISGVLDLVDELYMAKKVVDSGKDKNAKDGINLIFDKLSKFLNNQGVVEIETTSYNQDLHEVISIVPDGTNDTKIIDVIKRGYTLNGKPIRYSKIIISK